MTKKPTGPHKRTIARIHRAVSMLAHGQTHKQAAAELGIGCSMLHQWRRRYPVLFAEAQEHADQQMRRLVSQVRRAVGSDRILDDPDAYLAKARAAEKWTAKRGEELFPTGSEPTLSSVFETRYLPRRLTALQPMVERYRITLSRWRLITGDPPIGQITAELLCKFRDVLAASAGADGIHRMAARTVYGHIKALQTILDFCGPPGPRRRDCLGLIDRVPWARPPQPEWAVPRTVPIELIEQVYIAASCMDTPGDLPFKPARFWRALLAVAYFTSLRAGTLFALRFEWVDWAGQTLNIPADAMKAKRPHKPFLPGAALRHLRGIRTDRELIFPLPWVRRQFWIHFHRLQDCAGIPAKGQFGLAVIRKTASTIVAEKCGPEVASLFLGHAPIGVALQHYVRLDGLLKQAAEALPVPEFFKCNGA